MSREGRAFLASSCGRRRRERPADRPPPAGADRSSISRNACGGVIAEQLDHAPDKRRPKQGYVARRHVSGINLISSGRAVRPAARTLAAAHGPTPESRATITSVGQRRQILLRRRRQPRSRRHDLRQQPDDSWKHQLVAERHPGFRLAHAVRLTAAQHDSRDVGHAGGLPPMRISPMRYEPSLLSRPASGKPIGLPVAGSTTASTQIGSGPRARFESSLRSPPNSFRP